MRRHPWPLGAGAINAKRSAAKRPLHYDQAAGIILAALAVLTVFEHR